jgi:uncharacterized membrane protein YozB (DUF420 family)
MGLLGTKAPLLYDLNLILQIVIIIILFTGAYYAKRKYKYQVHGKIMGLAILLNVISILFVMAPRLLENLNFLISNIAQPPVQVAVIHPVFGGLAVVLGIAILAKLRPCGSKMGTNIRYLMRITLTIWTIAFLLGLSIYIAFYVL